MDEKELKTFIKIWKIKARKIKNEDTFAAFVFIWICFNALLAFYSKKDIDKGMIDWFLKQKNKNFQLWDVYENLIQIKHPTFSNSLKFFVELTPIEDSRDSSKNVYISDISDFRNIIWGIYKIRCNLFHGGMKINEEGNDKKVLFCYNILSTWITSFYADWNV